jgi:amidase
MSIAEAGLDLARAGAGEHAKAIARGELSAVEAVEAAIGRVESLNDPLNAVVVKDYDRAREAAKAADAALARGERGALLGVPMTVKESFNVAGLPTTWGFEAARDFIADEDALVVQRLKGAGAIILGKTNVPPSLADWQSNNPVYGRTLNPHDHGRSPGGSSGGSAAALAAGMVPLEYGSDIGGSIRVPAVFCGVYGHKPSFNLVPSRGQSAPRMRPGAGRELAVVGPMARNAEDLDLALALTAGPAPEDAVSYGLLLAPPRHTELRGFRVLVLDRHPTAACDSEVLEQIEALASRLEGEGAAVARRSALLPDLAQAHRDYIVMLNTIMSQGQPDARPVDAHTYLALTDERFRLRQQWARLFQDFDVVLAPAFGRTAFPHEDNPDWSQRRLTIDNEATPYGAQLAWPGLATYPGLPATAIPLGMSRDGLPIGAQLIGPWLEDRTPLRLAGLLAR